MSSLWTPGGEVPVDRNRPDTDARTDAETEGGVGAEAGGESGRRTPDEEALRAEYERMQQQVLEAPAAAVVAQHAVALYELAALHLAQERPQLAEARLAIDALTALVEGVQGRLGDAEEALVEALPRLKMAFVEATDRRGGRTGD